ncbi:MAG: PstS family phosphate ABC transporter substrate-binding protein [Opitutia bacterium]|jgi:hypothetical protein
MARLLSILLLAVAPCLRAATVAGSDALAETLGTAVQRHLAADGGKHTVAFRGTLPALEGLDNGTVDVALVILRESQQVDKTSDGKPIRRITLGAVAAYVYAHPSLPVQEVSLGTLAAIFGVGQAADYKFWSDVPGVTFPEPILPFTTGAQEHPSSTLFHGIALGGRPFRSTVRLRVDPAFARDTLASRTNAIVVADQPMPEGVGRLLRVADRREGRSSTGYFPDENNIYNADYPLRLPLVLCVREDRLASQRELVRWLLSDEAASHLRRANFVPAPKLIRERLAQRLDSN